MLQQFLAQNVHFAICLFASLACFAVFWLIFDAWSLRKELKELLKWVGFLLLALAFLAMAAIVEQSGTIQNGWGGKLEIISWFLRLLGFGALIAGQIMDPLQVVPEVKGIDLTPLEKTPEETVLIPQPTKTAGKANKKPPTSRGNAAAALGLGTAAKAVLPVGALAVGGLYWRRAHQGLERHLKPLAWVFFGFAAFECTWLVMNAWRDSTNPVLFDWAAPLSLIWFVNHLFLLVSSAILGKWVWHYLVKRLQSQLFMIFTSLTVGICLVTTVSFTYLLMRNVETQSFENLQTAGQVLNYALTSKEEETKANAQTIADSKEVAFAIVANDRDALSIITEGFLAEKGLSSLVITDADGQIVLRSEDPERFGQSLSDDALVRRALLGGESAGVITRQGVVAPEVAIQSAIPVRSHDDTIVGVVRVERLIDNAFADGIKEATGLDSSVYAGQIRASTTFVAPDGHTRWVGIQESNDAVVQAVLTNGQAYNGLVKVLNRSYLAVYLPLMDVDNEVIGMLFVGQSQISFLQAIARSVELTFLIIAGLIIFLTMPAYLIARRLTRQLE